MADGGAMTEGEGAGEDGRAEAEGLASLRAEGRARVRRVLMPVLAGLRIPGGKAGAGFQPLLDSLPERLAHLTEGQLEGVAQYALMLAGSARNHRGACPHPSVLLAAGFEMAPPPPSENLYLASLMRSVAGAQARDGGFMVQLYRTARRFGPPPGKYMRARMLEDAYSDGRHLAVVRERVAQGVATSEDRRWLDAWHADEAAAEALVAEGVAARAAKAGDAGEEVAA